MAICESFNGVLCVMLYILTVVAYKNMVTACDTMDASPREKLFGKQFNINIKSFWYPTAENNPL